MRTLLLYLSMFQHGNDTLPVPEPPNEFRKIIYRTTVKLNNGGLKQGFLVNIDDSASYISGFPKRIGSREFSEIIPYQEVNTLVLRRKNRVGRGALTGALIGLGAGVIMGLVEGDDPVVPPEQDFLGLANAFRLTAGEKVVLYGFSSTVTGGLIGALIGVLAKKRFTINGKRDKHELMKLTVLERAYSQKSSN